MKTQKVYAPPLEPGFMRNGFFAWPERDFKCIDCGADFKSASVAQRCAACRKLRRSHYDNPGGKRRPR